jgi:prepilin-type N-terminal cleavage/methylation domain-containing protein
MNRNKSGFTLVELLMVVMVIAVLVGIGVPVAFNTRKEARIANAKQGISDIETAVEHFFQEYGRLPNYSDSMDIIRSLAGEDNTDNPKAKRFLNVMESEESDWKGKYEDPWEAQYYIEMDENYDRRITFEGHTVTNHMVVVYSSGPDRILKTKDDVLSVPMPKGWNQ